MNSEIVNGFGKLTEEHHMHINKNATPVIHPSRKIPVALRDRFEKELDTLKRNIVIKRIEEPTDWVSFIGVFGKTRWISRNVLIQEI